MRKGSMIEGMFLDVASREEVKQLDRMLERKNFGGAETFALRRIVPVWTDLLKDVR